VRIYESKFDPNPVIIKRGGTVTWVNDDSARHQIVGVGYESGVLLNGGTFSRTYERVGTFPYHCRYRPQMRGEVRVT
jgi:plastocyanin